MQSFFKNKLPEQCAIWDVPVESEDSKEPQSNEAPPLRLHSVQSEEK
jgi:hypothetical protein